MDSILSGQSGSDDSDVGFARAAGAGALVFVALLVLQNIIRAGEPGFDATPAGVAAYFGAHRVEVVLPLCLFPLGMVALLTFVSGLRSQSRIHAKFWIDLGTLAVLVIAGLFAVVNIAEISIAVLTRDDSAPAAAIAALWAVHAGAFGLNLAAIAVALVALAHAAAGHGLVPVWMTRAAGLGAACLFVAATGNVWLAEGAPVLYAGLCGFLVWALFLLMCGVGLLRATGPVSPTSASTGGPRSMNTVIHAAFRRDLARFDAALATFPAGSEVRAAELDRAWRHYVAQLHQHHEGEEQVFFPAIARVEDVAALLDELEGEHAALLDALAGADRSIGELRSEPSETRARSARDALDLFGNVLEEHLTHEEAAFEPLAAAHAHDPEMLAAEREIRARHRKDSGAFFAWLLDGASPNEAAALRRLIPPPVLGAASLVGGRSYRAEVAGVWR